MIRISGAGSRILLWLFLASSGLLLSACNTTPLMVMPKVKIPDAPALVMPISKQASFRLDKVIASIKRGTVVLHFPAEGLQTNVGGWFCNHKSVDDNTVEWRSGSRQFGNWSTELGEVFHEVLSNKGYNIKGDPKKLFNKSDDITSEYLIGARIKEIRGNVCQSHHWWDGHPLRKFSGEVYIVVEWRVFSVLLKKEILVVETKAYHLQKKPKNQFQLAVLNDAFANASEALLEDERFRALALRENEATDKEYVFKGKGVELPRLPLRTRKIENKIGSTLSAVVTVRVAGGHGSGFAISESGYILTNAHVVGKVARVAIALSNGLEVEGRVVSINEQRDVALIKAAVRIPRALSIREKLPKPLEKVFVIGSPLSKSLQSTVTTGIISALRRREPSGLTFIQSDAAISGGNSGGPMLDENGNVLGISVSSFNHPKAQSLNNFIPINSALRALKITLSEKIGSR